MRTPWWARPLRSSRVSLSLSQAAGRELSGELRIDDRLPRSLSEGATPQSALHIITRRSTANLQRCSNAHSPKCLEGVFSAALCQAALREGVCESATRFLKTASEMRLLRHRSASLRDLPSAIFLR